VSSISSIPPALLALLIAVGVATLASTAVAAYRLPPGRHRTAWTLWACASAVYLAAMALGSIADAYGVHDAEGPVSLLLAAYAALAALGIAARLPARAIVVRQLVLDGAPLVLAVVAVASVAFGGIIDDSFAHVADHIVAPAAYTVLVAISIQGMRYIGNRTTPTARLISAGLVVTALAGGSAAFLVDPAAYPIPRAIAWIVGLVAVSVGACLRAHAPADSPRYKTRPDPITGWSWAAMLGVGTLVLLVILHRGPEDALRQIAAVIAFACFAARSAIARRQGARLMAELRTAEARFRTLVEQIPLTIYTDALDATSTTQYISPAIDQLLGFAPEELERNPDWFPEALHPDDREWVLQAMHEWQADGTAWEHEFRLIAKDGSVRWVLDSAVIVHDEHGAPIHAQGYMQDVTERKRAEADLRESERRYRDTLEGVNLLALSLDSDGIVTYCNDHVCEVTGWAREELVGRDWYETVGPIEHRTEFLQAVRENDLKDASEERLRTRSGADRVILWWDTVSRDESGAIVGVNSIGQDITDRRHAEQRLAFLRQHDEMTGIPNRTFFTERLAEAITHAQDRGRSVGVVFVNLENFRVVNDAYGHAIGDAVLCQFADRLREAADGTTLVARHGGDEFMVLLADMEDDIASTTHLHPADVAQMAAAIGGRVRHILRRPFVHGSHEIYLSTRTGTGVFPTQADGVDDLLKTAHVDAYRTTAVALHGHRAVDQDMAPREELELVARMHHAIERREFILHYQPVVDLASGAVTGVEALIRWQLPDGEIVPPNHFIPLAERTGLITPITDWVIEAVCAQTADWRRRGIELDVGFNFPVGLWDRSTLLNMLAVIRAHGLAAGDVVIEVTESAVISDAERSSGAIDVVREHGMRLAIDDFGTGYSSLSRLAELPASVLKVDRSFVRGVPEDLRAVALTKTIVQLANGIGMGVLAEGIETEDQRRFLAELGCTLGQGFLFSRPVPAAEIEGMLAVRRRAA
jgi:diguanylate cyclase (GGDEF)-like protein/PAS domain S-box-containing protein